MIGRLDAVLTCSITAVPFAFLVGLMRSSLSRAGAVSALFERLGGVGARDALAEALGDDTLDARLLAARPRPLRRRRGPRGGLACPAAAVR